MFPPEHILPSNILFAHLLSLLFSSPLNQNSMRKGYFPALHTDVSLVENRPSPSQSLKHKPNEGMDHITDEHT